MSDYLNESRIEVGNQVYYPTSYMTASHIKAGRGLLDSLDAVKSQEAEAKWDFKSAQERPTLQAPQKTSSPDELMVLAEAFITAFSAMNKGIQAQTDDFVKLQELDQTQSQAILDSTRNAMKKEKAAIKVATEVSDYEKKMADEQKYFGWAMMGLGAVLMVAVFASAFFTAGATAAIAPEVVADVAAEAGAEEGASMFEDVGIESDDLLSSSDLDTSEGVGNADLESSDSTEIDEQTQQAKSTLNKALDESDSAVGKSVAKWSGRIAKFLGKLGVKMALGAGFASPMLMKGIVSLKTADKLKDVAKAQLALGNALAKLQQNNMYFQFLQQLTQREGGVLQEEVNDASEIVDTLASIASGYRGITYGLANAV